MLKRGMILTLLILLIMNIFWECRNYSPIDSISIPQRRFIDTILKNPDSLREILKRDSEYYGYLSDYLKNIIDKEPSIASERIEKVINKIKHISNNIYLRRSHYDVDPSNGNSYHSVYYSNRQDINDEVVFDFEKTMFGWKLLQVRDWTMIGELNDCCNEVKK